MTALPGPLDGRRPLAVGIQLPEVEWEARWPDLRALALPGRGARLRLGLVRRPPPLPAARRRPARGPWEAWTMLAGLAAVTSRVTLGPLVAATAFHSPGDAGQDGRHGGRDQRRPAGPGPGRRLERDRVRRPSASRSTTGSAASRRRSRSSGRSSATGAIDFAGEFFTARDCELAPAAAAGRPAAAWSARPGRGCWRSRSRTSTPGTPGSTRSATGRRACPPLREQVDAACRERGPGPGRDRADGRGPGAAPGRAAAALRASASGPPIPPVEGIAGGDRRRPARLRRRGDRPRPARRRSDHARLARRAGAGPGGPGPGLAPAARAAAGAPAPGARRRRSRVDALPQARHGSRAFRELTRPLGACLEWRGAVGRDRPGTSRREPGRRGEEHRCAHQPSIVSSACCAATGPGRERSSCPPSPCPRGPPTRSSCASARPRTSTRSTRTRRSSSPATRCSS